MTNLNRWPLAIVLLVLGANAHAAVFNVTNAADAPDFTPGDGACNINPPGPAPVCTLRAAMMEANVFITSDEIRLPANMTVVLGSALPTIVNPLVVRGIGVLGDPTATPKINGNISYRLFNVQSGNLLLSNLSLVGGRSSIGAALTVGATATADVEYVNFFDNASTINGGAISNSGLLNVSRSSLYVSIATNHGGAIYTTGSAASLVLSDSSIRRSYALNPSAEAIYATNGANVTIRNTLIDGVDLLQNEENSGGISTNDAGNILVENSTFYGFTRSALQLLNAAGPDTIRVYNSIFAGSLLADCTVTSNAGASVSLDYNLIEDNTCAAISGANVLGGDPNLDDVALASNGVVSYRAPNLGSPVIDAASPAPSLDPGACIATDQRGTARPLDGNADGLAVCDLGAIEASAFTSDTFVVNYGITDGVDANPGDGICSTSTVGRCTLRAAVMEANAKAGPDVIQFDLTGGGGNGSIINLALPAAVGAEGGDLDITEALSIEGPIVDGRPIINVQQFRAGERHFEMSLPNNQPVIIQGLILSGGDSSAISGGSIRMAFVSSVTVDTVELRDNQSSVGGGAIAVVGGYLALRNSDLHDNSTGGLGAALYVGADGRANVRQTSFWNNADTTPAGGSRETIEIAAGGDMSMSSSTLAFNNGGIHASQPKYLSISASTVAYNVARGLDVEFGALEDRFLLKTTIVSGNGVEGCRLTNQVAADELSLDAYNLLEDGSCNVGATNIVAPALLEVLPAPLFLTQPEGSLSRVVMPLNQPGSVSPALDNAPTGVIYCAGFIDQRGLPRPVNLPDVPNGAGSCDIGAVELQAPPVDTIFANGFGPVT